jgi:hypothetical protein
MRCASDFPIDESPIRPDFAGKLLGYIRNANLETTLQNQNRPVNNMNMGDQNMLSNYGLPALTCWRQKRFLLAAFLTLVTVSTTASPVSIRSSSAQEPSSTDQLQPALNDEPPSSDTPAHAPEKSLQTVKGGRIALASSSAAQCLTCLFASPGANEAFISLPFNARVVNVWMSERTTTTQGQSSHVGAAVISTTSVQLSQSGASVRVQYHSNWDSTLPVIAMVFATSSVTGQTSGFLLDRRF